MCWVHPQLLCHKFVTVYGLSSFPCSPTWPVSVVPTQSVGKFERPSPGQPPRTSGCLIVTRLLLLTTRLAKKLCCCTWAVTPNRFPPRHLGPCAIEHIINPSVNDTPCCTQDSPHVSFEFIFPFCDFFLVSLLPAISQCLCSPVFHRDSPVRHHSVICGWPFGFLHILTFFSDCTLSFLWNTSNCSLCPSPDTEALNTNCSAITMSLTVGEKRLPWTQFHFLVERKFITQRLMQNIKLFCGTKTFDFRLQCVLHLTPLKVEKTLIGNKYRLSLKQYNLKQTGVMCWFKIIHLEKTMLYWMYTPHQILNWSEISF